MPRSRVRVPPFHHKCVTHVPEWAQTCTLNGEAFRLRKCVVGARSRTKTSDSRHGVPNNALAVAAGSLDLARPKEIERVLPEDWSLLRQSGSVRSATILARVRRRFGST
jgi:hypothetical protein